MFLFRSGRDAGNWGMEIVDMTLCFLVAQLVKIFQQCRKLPTMEENWVPLGSGRCSEKEMVPYSKLLHCYYYFFKILFYMIFVMWSLRTLLLSLVNTYCSIWHAWLDVCDCKCSFQNAIHMYTEREKWGK